MKLPISLKLEEGAVFLADSHVNSKNRLHFERALNFFERESPPQIFWMGDIFDLLIGGLQSSLREHSELIEKMEALAKVSDSFYLEGNHDFFLGTVFKSVKTVPRTDQPLMLELGDRRAALLHGDLWTTKSYEIYITLLQKRFVTKGVLWLNELLNDAIAEAIRKYTLSKKICKKIDNFDKIVKDRLKKIEADTIIEGHFHQGVSLGGEREYYNLPSFACDRSIGVWSGSRLDFVKV